MIITEILANGGTKRWGGWEVTGGKKQSRFRWKKDKRKCVDKIDDRPPDEPQESSDKALSKKAVQEARSSVEAQKTNGLPEDMLTIRESMEESRHDGVAGVMFLPFLSR